MDSERYVDVHVNNYCHDWEDKPDGFFNWNEHGFSDRYDEYHENLDIKFDMVMMSMLDDTAQELTRFVKRVRPGDAWTWMLTDEEGNHAFYIHVNDLSKWRRSE